MVPTTASVRTSLAGAWWASWRSCGAFVGQMLQLAHENDEQQERCKHREYGLKSSEVKDPRRR